MPPGEGRVLGALQGNVWGTSPAGSWGAGLSRQHGQCSGSLGEPGTAFCGLGGLGRGLPEPGCSPLTDEGAQCLMASHPADGLGTSK